MPEHLFADRTTRHTDSKNGIGHYFIAVSFRNLYIKTYVFIAIIYIISEW